MEQSTNCKISHVHCPITVFPRLGIRATARMSSPQQHARLTTFAYSNRTRLGQKRPMSQHVVRLLSIPWVDNLSALHAQGKSCTPRARSLSCASGARLRYQRGRMLGRDANECLRQRRWFGVHFVCVVVFRSLYRPSKRSHYSVNRTRA